MYTLAGENDAKRGWGLRDESFRAHESLRRFDPDAWFRLGDRDLGTHLFRTQLVRAGATLSEATVRIGAALGLRERVLPMTDDVVRTIIETRSGLLTFQQYHVRDRSRPEVVGVRYEGAATARPAQGVTESLERADVILVAPSNPVSSIGPILSIPAIRAALTKSTAPIVGLSGIRGGAPYRGDADRFLTGLGLPVSALAVAGMYQDWIDGFVIDEVDAGSAPDIESLGLAVATVDAALEPLGRGVAAVQGCIDLATVCRFSIPVA
jgi:LPPG:FO 2-phospho-L-lactate transferase